MRKSIEVQKLNDRLYIINLISELLNKCGIVYKGMEVRWNDELASVTYKKRDKIKHVRRLKPYKPIKMVYVDIDNYVDCHRQMTYNDIPDETYDKFYVRLGYLVLDNDLINKGYDITATLLN